MRLEGEAVGVVRIANRTLELVGVPSTTGEEQIAIDVVASWLAPIADDVDVWATQMADLEADPDFPGTEVERTTIPVVAALIKGSRPGPRIVLSGHVDTVPIGDPERWTRDPNGELDGDTLYGRGASDMKAGMVAAVEAFGRIAEGGREFPGEVVLVAVSGEEDGGSGTLAAIRRGWTGEFVIISEPTAGTDGPQIVVAHGGALTFTIEVEGRAAHAAVRREGVSALDHLYTVCEALRSLEKELNAAESNERMTALGLPYPTTVGIVRGGEWASNVMDSITAEVRVGVTIDETIPQAVARFERSLRSAIAGDPWLDVHPIGITLTGARFGSSSISADHPLVAAVSDAAQSVTGTAPARIGVPYGCDMALWTRVGGAAALVYGPGDLSWAHAVDERVSIAQTATVVEVLVEAVLRIQGIAT
jgi:acetylornithine deacetylase